MRYRQERLFFTFRYVFGALFCSFLILSAGQYTEALRPSPAGGGWLELDDEHDFVSTVKAWFPDEQFGELTVEAWVYVDELPDPETYWSIAGQEGRFELVIHSFAGGSLGMAIEEEGADCSAISGLIVPTRKWVHVAAFCKAGAGYGLDGSGFSPGKPGGHLSPSDKPLRIGGMIPEGRFIGRSMKLRGCIDEVRISSVLRYPVGFVFDYEVPEARFEVDEDTLCLWHFDEELEADRYEDVSGNGHHLWRSEVYAVHASGKLSVKWGQLKQ